MDGNFKAQLKKKRVDENDKELTLHGFFPDETEFRKFLSSVDKEDDVSLSNIHAGIDSLTCPIAEIHLFCVERGFGPEQSQIHANIGVRDPGLEVCSTRHVYFYCRPAEGGEVR